MKGLKKICSLAIAVFLFTNSLSGVVMVQAENQEETPIETEITATDGEASLEQFDEIESSQEEIVALENSTGEEELVEDTSSSVEVKSSSELENAINSGFISICIAADFEVDRTFYITEDTHIYTEETHTITRAASFAGDIFVVGEDSEGNAPATEETGEEDDTAEEEASVIFTLGSESSNGTNLLVIDGNKDNMTVDVAGTVLFVCNNAQVDLYYVTIQNCYKNSNVRALEETYKLTNTEYIGGAAIINALSTVNIYSCAFTNNGVHNVEGEASSRGGSIYAFGALNIYGATFEGNYAARGGALYNYRTTHIYNAKFNENTATANGGAIYVPASTVAYLYLGEENDVVERSVVFEGNSAGDGGAIYATGVLLNSANTEFSSNTATGSGGAVYSTNELTVLNADFLENTAVNGGAIYAKGEVAVVDSTLSRNAATSGGGGAYITDCIAEFGNTIFADNEAGTHGGAIYAIDLAAEENALSVNGATFSANAATKNGGAIYINNAPTKIADSEFSLNTSCEANGGGAIYSTKSTSSITGTDFSENSTTLDGGAIYYNSESSATLESVTFTSNTAAGKGGAICLGNSSTAEMVSSTFTGNVGASGGAIALASNSKLLMNDINARGNIATSNGGFLHNNASTLNMYNSEISESDATGNGGAMYFTTSAAANIYKTAFTENGAAGIGGALYIYTGGTEVMLHSCEFDSNEAKSYGGVAYLSNKSVVKMYNTTAKNNSASKGGFLYETTTGTTLTLVGATVSGNTATDGGSIIWGNSAGAVLNIDKSKYTDLDTTGDLDDTYWASAIVNNLTVYEVEAVIPDYTDYGEEEDPENPGDLGEITIKVKSSSALETAIKNGFTSICIAADFEIDRTFYIARDMRIYSEEVHTLTRAADFSGDMFVIGEDAEGNAAAQEEDTEGDAGVEEASMVFTLGNASSDGTSLLVIDGNKDNMTATVTGTALFVCNDAQADIYSVTIKNCYKGSNERTLDEKYNLSYTNRIGGAAIINASSTVNVYSGTFSNNGVHNVDGEDSAWGGAIYSFGTTNIYGGEFTSNSAARAGAIYNYHEGHIYNAQFNENTATNSGGAIYMPASTLCFLYLGEENDIIESSVVFDGNSADDGGAIYVQGVLDVKNTEFKNNSASNGGAIYGSGEINGNKAVTVADSAFSKNSATSGGGAIHLTGSRAKIGNVTFSENEAGTHGGAIYAKDLVDAEVALTVNGSSFLSNAATSNAGAMYINNAKTSIADSEFSLNTSGDANGGGAIYSTKSSLNVTGAEFSGNSTSSVGGAISLNTTSVAEIISTSFTSNSSASNGGAISVLGGSEVLFNNVTATSNTAIGSGGFLHVKAATVNMYNSEIEENSANVGGAMNLLESAVANVYKTTFTSNEAVSNSGALYIYTGGTEVMLHSCEFDSNVSGNYGGAAYVSSKSVVKMYNTTAKNNSAKNGGFLYETTTGTTLTLVGATVSGNTATNGGPIIWGNSTGAVLNIDKSKYKDLDATGDLDDTYWASAIVNKLTVNEVTQDIPKYLDYGNEEYTELADAVDVASAEGLASELAKGTTNIRIIADIEVDRTFYVTNNTTIFSTIDRTLTRATNFAGDMFVIGEDEEGNYVDQTVTLTIGNPYSETEGLLVIDGNKDNMTVDVTGTVFFLSMNSQLDTYTNLTVINNYKKGNVRTLEEKYGFSSSNRVGGSVAVVANGTMNVYGGLFKNNSVNDENTEEGADESERDSTLGGAIYNRSNLFVYGGSFEENTAARGGAVYNMRPIKLYGGQFVKNHSYSAGGAIYLAASEYSQLYAGDMSNPQVSDKILFKENYSDSNSGAIYISTKAIAVFYGDTTFDSNYAYGSGGAISSYGMLNANYVEFKNNSSRTRGGVVYISNASETSTTRIVNIENCILTDNTSRYGGAIAIYAADETYDEGGIAEIKNSTFKGNKAIDTTTGGTTSVYGGAIYTARKGSLTIEDSTFEANEALTEGGAIYATGESTIAVADSSFIANKTTSETDAKGGAVSVHSAYVDFDGVSFTNNNTLKNGAALYVSYTGTSTVNSEVTVTNSSFEGNNCQSYGAAIYVTTHDTEQEQTELTVQDTSFVKNTATLRGGAVYITAGADAYMKEVTFEENTVDASRSSSNGGAIYVTASDLEIDTATFSKNSAGGNGGAMAILDLSNVVLNKITAVENSGYYGGFIYNNSSALTVFESEITKNAATYNAGGAYICGAAVTSIFSTDFTENTAGNNAGAIYAYTEATETVIHSCKFDANSAQNYGGVMYASNMSITNLYNNTMTNNTALRGGVLYETVSGTMVNVNTMMVSGNSATEAGPIIYGNNERATLNIHKSNYTDLENSNTEDDSYWEYAVANELTVNDTSYLEEEIPECESYVEKEEQDEEQDKVDTVPVATILDLGINSSDASISSAYGKLKKLDNSSNFMSLNTTTFENINDGTVTVDSFVYHSGEAANNCNVGQGLLIYQAILYKEAHPEEEVSISLGTFRFSTQAAVCINRNSRYFGYMRHLSGVQYDKYGFVRISYLLVTAAKMGINVTAIGQLDGYPKTSSEPGLEKYFEGYMDDPCDPAYVPDGKIGDYLNFKFCYWTSYGDKGATDMMHIKMCAVSHYLDMNGVEHKNAVWSGTTNLDGINSVGTNGNDKMQTATIVSDHEQIYRTTANYIDLVSQYCGQEDVYLFRSIATERIKNQIDLILAGNGNQIAENQQIVYLGTEKDDVFELYFAPFAGDASNWNESYNPYCKYLREMSNSDDYVWFMWNNANYNSSTMLIEQMEQMISDTFHNNKNVNNKIYVNLEEFNQNAYSDLKVGEDIGLMSFNKKEFGALHSKDLQLSYANNGERKYVSLLNSLNVHSGSMYYQSNFMLVVKETNCNEDSVFFTIADNTSKGVVEHHYSELKEYIPEKEDEDGYTYTECSECGERVIYDPIHRPGDWIVAKESTETTNGIMYKECLGCGMILTAKETSGAETDLSNVVGKVFDKSVASLVSIEIASLPHTFEAVVSVPESVEDRAGVIVGNYKVGAKDLISFEIYSGGRPRLYYKNNGQAEDCIFDTDIRTGNAEHIAITVDGFTATLYVNGDAVEQKTLTVEMPEAIDNLKIGGDNRSDNSQYFKGTIYSVHLFNDVRTAEKIKRDMLLVEPDSNELLLSKYFEGESNYVNANDIVFEAGQGKTFDAETLSLIGNLSTTPHTFEAVLNLPSNYGSGRGGVIVSNYADGSSAQIAVEIYTDGRPRLFYSTGSKKIDCLFSSDIRADEPVHMAITVEGTQAMLYIDGELKETRTVEAEIPETTANYAIGGDHRTDNAQYFKGKIYSVAMFGDARNSDEVKKDAILVASDSESLLYSGYFAGSTENAFLDVCGQEFGIGKIVTIPEITGLPHTFEAVVSVPESVEDRAGVIVGNYKVGVKDLISFEIYSGGRPRLYYKNNGQAEDCIFDTDIRTGNAEHIAITVDGFTATLYVNGDAVEQKTLTVEMPQTTEDLKVAGDNRSDNLQYFKGKLYSVALYENVKTDAEINKGIFASSAGLLYSTCFSAVDVIEDDMSEGRVFTADKYSLVDVNIENIPYTLEATVNVPSSIDGRAGVIVGNYKLGNKNLISFEIYSGGRPRLYYKNNGKAEDCTFDTDIRSNKKEHIAISVDDLMATLYVNGVKVEEKALTIPFPDATENLKIGGDIRIGNLQYFKGAIYDVALFGDVRSAQEVKNDMNNISNSEDELLYNIDFTGSICPESPIGAGHCESDWIIVREPSDAEYGLKHKICTACGVTLATNKYSKVSTEDAVEYASGLVLASEADAHKIESTLTASPKTIEAVFKLSKDYTNRAGVIVGNYDGSTSEQINIEIYNNGKPRLYYKANKVAYTYLFSTDVRSDSATHLSITIDGLTATLYLNGVQKETIKLDAEFSTACDNFVIGADNRTSGPQYFKGEIYCVHLFEDVRSAEEIKLDSILVASDTEGLIYSKFFTN